MPSRNFKVYLLGDSASLNKALGDTEKGLAGFGQKLEAFGKNMTTKVTLPIVAGLTLATKAAADEAQEQAVLAKTLQNTVGATNAQVAATEKWITKMQNATGFADGQLRPALGKLVIAGRSVEQAQGDMAVAMDIARARGLDLETVVQAMSKAALGNVAGLGRLGIATKNAAGETLTYDEILKEASKTMGGAAAAAADTAAGRAEILRAKMADLAENIGTSLLPILERLTAWVGKVIEKWEALSPTTQGFIVKAALVVAAIGPALTVLGNLVAVIRAVGAALMFASANPIVLIIAGIVALVAAIVLMIKNWDKVKEVVGKVWDWITDKVTAGVNWVIGKLNVFLSFLNKIIPVVNKVLGTNFGKIELIGPVGQTGVTGSAGATARLADGGIVKARPGGTLATIGEGGQDEAVIPLNKMGQMGGNTYVTVNVQGSVTSERNLVDAIHQGLLSKSRRGALGLT